MLDLGNGVTGDLVRHRLVCCAEDHEHGGWSGVAVHHPGVDGSDCVTTAFWCESRLDDAQNVVELVAVDPLEVKGKITCPTCGLSGSIRNGRWS